MSPGHSSFLGHFPVSFLASGYYSADAKTAHVNMVGSVIS